MPEPSFRDSDIGADFCDQGTVLNCVTTLILVSGQGFSLVKQIIPVSGINLFLSSLAILLTN